MNKTKFLKLTALLALASPVSISCGGGDDKTASEPQEKYVEDEREAGINKLCQMFGINKNDYLDLWMPLDINDKTILALARKSDNRVFVSVFDKKKNSVVYRNTDVSYTNTLSVSNYDTPFEGKIANIYPIYNESEKGYIVSALVWYTTDGEISIVSNTPAKCVQTLYFSVGNKTKTLEPTSSAFTSIEPWYNDSFILYDRASGYTCYTASGAVKFSDKMFTRDDFYFPISYDEFLSIRDFTFSRINVQNISTTSGNTVWQKTLKLVDDTSKVRCQYTVEDMSSSIWKMTAYFIYENGTTKTVKFTLNINTGEYTIEN